MKIKCKTAKPKNVKCKTAKCRGALHAPRVRVNSIRPETRNPTKYISKPKNVKYKTAKTARARVLSKRKASKSRSLEHQKKKQ